jgi:hypothetical protein
MRVGAANFRDTRHMEYTGTIDSGAFGAGDFDRIGTQTCLEAEKDT